MLNYYSQETFSLHAVSRLQSYSLLLMIAAAISPCSFSMASSSGVKRSELDVDWSAPALIRRLAAATCPAPQHRWRALFCSMWTREKGLDYLPCHWSYEWMAFDVPSRSDVDALLWLHIGPRSYWSDVLSARRHIRPTSHRSKVTLVWRAIGSTSHSSDVTSVRGHIGLTSYRFDVTFVRRHIGPRSHWSDVPSVWRHIRPTSHRSEGTLVWRPIDVTLVRSPIGLTSLWSDVPYVRRHFGPTSHWCNVPMAWYSIVLARPIYINCVPLVWSHGAAILPSMDSTRTWTYTAILLPKLQP